MSNNYFQFQIPRFNEDYGEDWEDFKDIVEDYVDHFIEKIMELYWFRQPDKIPLIALEISLRLRKISFDATMPVSVKRFKYRNFNTSFKGKALGDIYLDIAESITGIRGNLTYSTEGLVWDEWAWAPGEDNEWGGLNADSVYNIFFNVKTTDEAETDLIYNALMDKTYRPAFYQLILVDDDNNILRVVA